MQVIDNVSIKLRQFGFKPGYLGQIGNKIVEFTSYPFQEGENYYIMVLTEIGNPNSIAMVAIPAIAVDLVDSVDRIDWSL